MGLCLEDSAYDFACPVSRLRHVARIPQEGESKEDFEQIRIGHAKHLNEVFADRLLSDRIESMGEQSTKAGEVTLADMSVLDGCGDGADQA